MSQNSSSLSYPEQTSIAISLTIRLSSLMTALLKASVNSSKKKKGQWYIETWWS